MMSSDPVQNPYAPPPMDVAHAPSAKPGRPAWLVVICVTAIALGGMGLVNGLMGIGSVVYQDQLQKAFERPNQPGLPPELQQAQEEFEQKSRELQKEFIVPLMGATVARLAVAVGLMVGGVWCLLGKPRGREILIFVLCAGIVFEVGNGILQVVFTRHMLDLMNELFQKFVDNMPNRGGPPPEFMMGIMRGAMWFGLCLGVVWQLIKITFYFGGLLYLRRQAIADLFSQAASSSSSPT